MNYLLGIKDKEQICSIKLEDILFSCIFFFLNFDELHDCEGRTNENGYWGKEYLLVGLFLVCRCIVPLKDFCGKRVKLALLNQRVVCVEKTVE